MADPGRTPEQEPRCQVCGHSAMPPWLVADDEWPHAIFGQKQVCVACYFRVASPNGEPLLVRVSRGRADSQAFMRDGRTPEQEPSPLAEVVAELRHNAARNDLDVFLLPILDDAVTWLERLVAERNEARAADDEHDRLWHLALTRADEAEARMEELREALAQAHECCSRPPGTCFPIGFPERAASSEITE